MNTGIMKLADIIPAAYNPRKTLKPGDTEYEALSRSIDRFSLVEPLIVNSRNNVLVGGHQRLNVLKERGETEAEVIFVDLDDNGEKTLNIALNKIEGDWDYRKLEEMIAGMDAADFPYTGFSDDEIEGIIGISEETEAAVTAITESAEEPDTAPQEQGEKPFEVYFSFPTKEEAENWLSANGISRRFDGARAITVRMEE